MCRTYSVEECIQKIHDDFASGCETEVSKYKLVIKGVEYERYGHCPIKIGLRWGEFGIGLLELEDVKVGEDGINKVVCKLIRDYNIPREEN